MATKAKVLYNFNAETDCELTIKENEELTVTDKNVGEGWWSARCVHLLKVYFGFHYLFTHEPVLIIGMLFFTAHSSIWLTTPG